MARRLVAPTLLGLRVAASIVAFIYVAGLGAIWLVPETMGKALPE